MKMRHLFKKRPRSGWRGRFLVCLGVLLLLSSCSPGTKSEEELRKDLQALKTEVGALKERLAKLEAGQQLMLDLLKKPGMAPESFAPGEQRGPQPLSVSQLFAEKDRLIGTRVTVRGAVGPVLVHHKSLLLKAPEGMVEVFFGNLPDEKLVQRLTSTSLEQPLTVTGFLSLPSKGGAKLQITAEAIEF